MMLDTPLRSGDGRSTVRSRRRWGRVPSFLAAPCMGLALLAAFLPGEARAVEDLRFEVAPMAGFRWSGEVSEFTDASVDALEFGDDPAFGLNFGLLVGERTRVELSWSHQATSVDVMPADNGPALDTFDVDVDYLHIGSTYEFEDTGERLYVGVWLGGTSFQPEGGDREFKLSVALGVGVKYLFSKNFGLRLQGRIIPTIFDSDSTVLCTGSGTCYVTLDSASFWQPEIMGGVVLRF